MIKRSLSVAYVGVFLFVAHSMFGAAAAHYSIPAVSQEKIEKLTEKITADAKKNRLIRYAIIGTGVTAGAILTTKFVSWLFFDKSFSPINLIKGGFNGVREGGFTGLFKGAWKGAFGLGAAAVSTSAQGAASAVSKPLSDPERISKNEKDIRGLNDRMDVENPKRWAAFESWKHFGNYLSNWGSSLTLSMMTTGGIMGVKKFCCSIFHDDDMDWFVIKKSALPARLQEFEKCTAGLDVFEKYTGIERQMYKQCLANIMESLVHGVERVAGFMQYKMGQFPEDAAQELVEAQNYKNFMITCANGLCLTVEKIIADQVDVQGNRYNATAAWLMFRKNFNIVWEGFSRVCEHVFDEDF